MARHLVDTFVRTSRDVKILWVSVFLRLAAFGASNIVLTTYLKALGISEAKIGMFMTFTLVGDATMSYMLTWYADSLGRRRVMVFGSFLMAVAGIIFATSGEFAILLVAAIVGVISPSGDEVGPFKSIEESAMAHMTPLADRPDVYAFHWLISCAGSATGTLFSGYLVQYLVHREYEELVAYRAVFYFYAAVGLLKMVSMLFLSGNAELNHSEHVDIMDPETGDTTPLLEAAEEEQTAFSKRLSRETVHVLSRLLCVFMLDSFAYGFMPATWIIYYFKTFYKLSPRSLGNLFFSTGVVNSISSLPSSVLAKSLGPVKATLVVQIPSSVFLLATPLASSLTIAVVLILLYYATIAMDVVPRQVLLTNLIRPDELTRAMGIVNIGKTFARCVGPSFTGKLASNNNLWAGFIINGSLTIMADLLLFIMFYHVDKKVLAKSSD